MTNPTRTRAEIQADEAAKIDQQIQALTEKRKALSACWISGYRLPDTEYGRRRVEIQMSDGDVVRPLLDDSVALIPAADLIPREEHERVIQHKDGAYSERNKLVAALSKMFPASIEQHDGADWEDDWRNVIYIDLPTRQVSWHIHDSELPLFAHLPRNCGREWDGHSTEEKYERLASLEVNEYIPRAEHERALEEAGGKLTSLDANTALGYLVNEYDLDTGHMDTVGPRTYPFDHNGHIYEVVVRRKADHIADAKTAVAPKGVVEELRDLGATYIPSNDDYPRFLTCLSQITELPEPNDWARDRATELRGQFHSDACLKIAAALLESEGDRD